MRIGCADFSAGWYNGTGWTTVEQKGSGSANDASYVYKTFNLSSLIFEDNPKHNNVVFKTYTQRISKNQYQNQLILNIHQI